MDLKIDSTITLNNETKMPRFGFGVYQLPDGPTAVNAISWALQAGYRHIDTAKLYKNEVSVGKAVRESGIPRDEIWITTKLWPTDLFHIEKAFETSLKKLDLGYIDLYLVHFPVPGAAKKVWKKMETIYKTGQVKAIGVSNYNSSQLRDTLDLATVPPSVNQMNCSVFGYNKKVYDLCQQESIAYEAYSPLNRGVQLQNTEVTKVADNYHKSTAQILLRWALQKNMVIIPKSQHQKRIIENANIFDFVINESDMKILDGLSD
ncbi:MAG: aldo/keto reductase family protein [Candidatus Saccharimonadales bacterium]